MARNPAPISTSCSPTTTNPTSDDTLPNHALSDSADAFPCATFQLPTIMFIFSILVYDSSLLDNSVRIISSRGPGEVSGHPRIPP
uniref:Uncharacterized protein n=1 Tax=Arundo donax TaxID=35708 RepID=A0A0A9FBI3_ARUDO